MTSFVADSSNSLNVFLSFQVEMLSQPAQPVRVVLLVTQIIEDHSVVIQWMLGTTEVICSLASLFHRIGSGISKMLL